MTKSTGFLVAASLLSIVVAAYALIDQTRAKSAMESALRDCNEAILRVGKSEKYALACNPFEILEFSRNPFADLVPEISPDVAIAQKRVLAAMQDKSNDNSGLLILASLLFFVGCLPYAWYFFLRRLSEVSSAIRGR